jgi:hypothetical protein
VDHERVAVIAHPRREHFLLAGRAEQPFGLEAVLFDRDRHAGLRCEATDADRYRYCRSGGDALRHYGIHLKYTRHESWDTASILALVREVRQLRRSQDKLVKDLHKHD